MGKDTVVVSGNFTVVTYNYLHAAADFALKQAVAKDDGSFYNCLYSIVMSAFCLEAYVNHIGMKHFPDWDEWAKKPLDELKRRPSPLDKLERLAEANGIEIDYGRRPFSGIKSANWLRNQLAHGSTKVIKVSYTEKLPAGSTPERTKAPWQEKCTKSHAKSCLDDLKEVITTIHEKYEPGKIPLGILGHGMLAKELK